MIDVDGLNCGSSRRLDVMEDQETADDQCCDDDRDGEPDGQVGAVLVLGRHG